MATYNFDNWIKNIPTNNITNIAKNIDNEQIKKILKKMKNENYKNNYNLWCKLATIVEKYEKNQKKEIQLTIC